MRVVWPILSGLALAQLVLGMAIGYFEKWTIGDAAYFTFVTGLTIGYGDLAPLRFIARLLAVLIGFIGIMMSGLIAAIGVRALQAATEEPVGTRPDKPSEY